MRLRLHAVLAMLCCAAALSGCLNDSTGLSEEPLTWVAIEPIQCLSNSWEIDWLEAHDGDYDAYPDDLEGEFAVIKSYFEELGASVRAIATRDDYSTIVCTACSCSRGDILYILVRDADVDLMLGEGFRLDGPSLPGPITWYD